MRIKETTSKEVIVNGTIIGVVRDYEFEPYEGNKLDLITLHQLIDVIKGEPETITEYIDADWVLLNPYILENGLVRVCLATTPKIGHIAYFHDKFWHILSVQREDAYLDLAVREILT